MKRNLMTACVLVGSLSMVQADSNTQAEPVQRRQAVFERLETELEALENSQAWQEDTHRWLELATDVRRMKTWYPPGSREGSRSRKSVWTKSEDFGRRLDELALNLERMAEAGALGNETGFDAYWEEVDSSCLGCHMRFKTLF